MPSQDFSSDDSLSSDPDSEAESQTSSQISFKPKQLNTRFMSWRFKFLDTIQADVLAGEFEDRTRRLIEHFRTRTTPDRPICILSVTIMIIADLKQLILALPNKNLTVSIAIIGYVQTKPSSPIAMTKWIPSATWEPVSWEPVASARLTGSQTLLRGGCVVL